MNREQCWYAIGAIFLTAAAFTVGFIAAYASLWLNGNRWTWLAGQF